MINCPSYVVRLGLISLALPNHNKQYDTTPMAACYAVLQTANLKMLIHFLNDLNLI